jgi:predicted DNA-binding transcriptional regulator AlpA
MHAPLSEQISAESSPEKPKAVQGIQRFKKQLDCGQTKFYELMAEDPRFPKRFKIGRRWVFFVQDCNAYVAACAAKENGAA